MLGAQVLLSQGRFDEAISALQAIDTTASTRRSGLTAIGRRMRASILAWRWYGRIAWRKRRSCSTRSEKWMRSRRATGFARQANLALGFSWLKLGRAADAEQVLQRVRLAGPQSNKALLGLGWAQSSEGKYSAALAPWLELKQRDLLDAAVQEAYLAIPFAYAQLKSDGQAAQYYNFAIDSFQQESARIDQSIIAVRSARSLRRC